MRFSRSIAAVTNIQRFKFFGLDARRDRFTGRCSGGLAEDIARVTCLIYGLLATWCISGKQVRLLDEFLYACHWGDSIEFSLKKTK